MPKASEVAKLAVANMEFEDWETVWVQETWMGGYPTFRFTAAERAPLPTKWQDAQFKPGDRCTILLGGQLAATGIITQRQVAYNATARTVQLSGAGMTWAASTSSVMSKDGNFDKMSLKPIADKVLLPFGVKALQIGIIDSKPFDRLSCQPGELVFDFLDRICRVRGVTLGSDHLGNMLLIGEHTSPIVQQLYEGKNILKLQCVMSVTQISTIYSLTGQKAVADDASAREAAEMEARANGTMKNVFKYLATVAEQPVKDRAEMEARANYQAIQSEGTLITAYVTVQGWLRDGKALWRPGENVWLYSPMAMLNMAMKIQMVTYEQDNKTGTTTTLELVLPWKLGDKIFKLKGTGPADIPGNAPPAPPPASTSSDTAPQDPKPPEEPPINV